MLPFELIQLIPDIATSAIFSVAFKRYLEKRAENKIEELISKETKKLKNKLNKNEEAGSKVATNTILTAKKSVKKSRELDHIAKKKYCNLLRYLYDVYEDEGLLEVMYNNGCITKEEIEQLEEIINFYEEYEGD